MQITCQLNFDLLDREKWELRQQTEENQQLQQENQPNPCCLWVTSNWVTKRRAREYFNNLEFSCEYTTFACCCGCVHMLTDAFRREQWAASIHQPGAFGGRGCWWAHGEVHGGVIPYKLGGGGIWVQAIKMTGAWILALRHREATKMSPLCQWHAYSGPCYVEIDKNTHKSVLIKLEMQ